MKLRCLIIDDEAPAVKLLARYISAINGMELSGQCRNAIEAFDMLQQKPIDVIFLDIKMPRMLGTDFLKNLSNPPKVIFVTAYREYAVDGFELEAVDYLVKPVSFERFFKSIVRVNQLIGREISLSVPLEKTTPHEPFIYLKVDRIMKKISLNEIIYIESWKDYVKIFLSNGTSFLVKQSISALENLLSDQKFIRVHRSYMVSVQRISGYNGIAVLLNETEIPIGRLYKQAFLERLKG